MDKALQLYNKLDAEFCMGSPRSWLNRKCKNRDELISYAMNLYANRRLRKFKQKLERINGTKQVKKKKIPKGWTKADVQWSEDLHAIRDKAEKYGVSAFLDEVERRKLKIDKYVKGINAHNEIVHHVRGWWFSFQLGSGKFINIH